LLCETEVQDFDAIVAGDEDVVGLEIAVNDAFFVGGGEAFGDLESVLDQFAARKSSGDQNFAKRLAFEKLRDKKADAVLLTDIVNGEDVGMIQRAQDFRLMLETMKAIGFRGESCRQNFQSDRAFETRVTGAVHLTHAP
jgi:hypothetical protein